MVVLGVLAAAGCSDGGDDKKGFAEACSADSDCSDGMFCARESSISGHCTKACSLSNTEICANTFGGLAYCNTSDLCALKCNGGACPGDLHCNTSVIPDTCWHP
jgi:hypothetical protein